MSLDFTLFYRERVKLLVREVRLAMEELKDVRSRRFLHRLILYTSGLYIEQ
jgi:hypothetical protein